jgi:hypothetical protein
MAPLPGTTPRRRSLTSKNGARQQYEGRYENPDCSTGGTITAEGDLDFRGTLAVSKDAPVGFGAIRLAFDLDTDAGAEQVQTLLRLTERYCVVYQTLAHPAELTISA